MRATRTHSVARLEPCGVIVHHLTRVLCRRKLTCEVYLCTHFLQTDLSFELGIIDDSVQC